MLMAFLKCVKCLLIKKNNVKMLERVVLVGGRDGKIRLAFQNCKSMLQKYRIQRI